MSSFLLMGIIGDIFETDDIDELLNHIEYIDKAIKWISIKCDEGIIYIVTNDFTDVAIYMTEVEICEEEVLSVGRIQGDLRR